MIASPAGQLFDELGDHNGGLAASREAMLAATTAVCESFRSGHRLYVCGSGPSHADALHVAAELVKQPPGRRPLPRERRTKLLAQPDGEWLAESLQASLPAVVLGSNGELATSVNDLFSADLLFAQELEALGVPGDVLLALSKSGSARNVVLAAEVARSLEITVVTMARNDDEGSQLAEMADVVIRLPEPLATGDQAWHAHTWHTWFCHVLCQLIDVEMFFGLVDAGSRRGGR